MTPSLVRSSERRPGCWPLLLFPVLGLSLAAIVFLNGQFPGLQVPAPPLIIDKPAPDFVAQSPDGQSVSLQSLRGKLVAVNFWATWCVPCRTEMPALQSAAARHSVLAVLAVDAGESADDVLAYTRGLGLSFHVVLDPASAIRDRYGVRVFPTTVWVDPAGIARVKHIGALTDQLIERYVLSLADQPSSQ
jgi:thiol-disulfide isomerase/thioredoxin